MMSRRIAPNPSRRLAGVALLALAAGCAQTRQYTIVTTPPDAVVRLEGDVIERKRGEIKRTLAFAKPTDTYSLVAQRPGYEDLAIPVGLNTPQGLLRMEMKPKLRPIVVNIEPADANVFLDGKPISNGRVTSMRFELPFALTESMQPQTHVLRAERTGYSPVETRISFTDDAGAFTLKLGTLKKDLVFTTTPSGARISLDGVDVGDSPITVKAAPFVYDPRKEAFIPRTLVATRPGYPITRQEIGWDEGKSDYNLTLSLFTKRVRIETEPSDVIVKIDGQVLKSEADGARGITLEFPPVNEAGQLKAYTVQASLEREGERWQPATATLGWDEGQTLYSITLDEILIRSVTARAIEYRFKDGKWSPVVVEANTTAWKDVTDGPVGVAKRVTDLQAGSSIASFALSPDGKLVVYALVEPDDKGSPKTRLYMARTDGVGGSTGLTDGRQLDLTPAFDPGGDAILFSSDRGGGPMQIWSIPVDGQSGATRLTAGNSDHLWPTLDTSAKPRVFFQALVPGQETPRLYSSVVGTIFETDLVNTGGFQPRLSPRNDALAFVQFTGTARKTDIFKTSDKGGIVQKMTDTPDVSERDPAWSPDGKKIAMTAEVPFANGQGTQTEIYVVDDNGGNLRAVTMNDALDDMPAWSTDGRTLYFRSNRGGKWDLWKITTN
jgi:Tol biopolymer transport system component